MENQNFKNSLAFTLKWEGGYSNDSQDPGKETNFGISKAANPDIDVKTLDKQKTSELYWNRYWMPSGAYYHPWPLCAAVFDAAVHHGPATAIKLLNTALQLFSKPSPETAASKICDLRLDLFKSIIERKPTMRKYYRGWKNRIADLRVLINTPVENPIVKKKKIG